MTSGSPLSRFPFQQASNQLKTISLLGGVLATVVSTSAATGADLRGTWLSQDGNAKVRISDCGSALCGTLVWLRRPFDSETHLPRTDKLNPDSSKRHLPMLGLQVAHGLRAARADRWTGSIYNADEGKSYQISITLSKPSEATLVGCVFGVVCKSEHWKKI